MDSRLIIFLIWCACNQQQIMFGLAILYEEEISSFDYLNEKGNSQAISSSDTEAHTDSTDSQKHNRQESEHLKRNARRNIEKGLKDEIDGDEYLPTAYLEGGSVDEFSLTSQKDAINPNGVKDGVLNDSPMNKYGSSYPYPLPPRRQTPEKLLYTNEIVLKQGRLKGIIRNMHPQTGLRDVDQFLGLPYAEAPIGSRRFMPPGTPLPWQKVKLARHLPPVCPQRIPDLANSSAKLSKGRYEQLIRILPYLKTENEDCLYLNVYVPREDGPEQKRKYPVIVYIHGESFEWNSGNPYDGSVLASYGQVIVVTLNYRLGVLGFMKPGINDDTVSNFGLLDQIAALHWIKENIGAFGGDRNSVTLMGHGTGAACVNYLMVSPVASGLFHRAILMSGSAMADWAVSNSSLQITMQIAHGLNCPINVGVEELLTCLRSKRYEDIQKIVASSPQFSTSLGPIVDGLVIPNQPYKVMSQYTELFSRYDLLFGVTELESYHTLNAPQLEDGMSENERDNLLRLYMQSRFNIRPDLALAATLKKYTDMYNNPIKASSLEHRDVVLDILSDARVVGPLIQTGLFHAEVNPRNYMYVFGHNSMAGPHSSLPHSIAGEELAFIFGAPLAPAGPFHNKYNAQEKLLSEAVMSYWTNFAKTGNPKAPWRGTFINLHALEWDRYDLDWPEFNKRNQCFINIGIPPSIGYKYRQLYMNYWNKELPDELNQIGTIQQHPYINNFFQGPTQGPRGGTSIYPTEIVTGQMSRFPHNHKNHLSTDDPQKALRILLQKTHPSTLTKTTDENMYNAQPTFPILHRDTSDDSRKATTTLPITTEPSDYKEVAKSESTMQLLIALIAVFIILNVIIYSAFIIQKKKKTTIMSRKFGILSYDGTTDDELKRTKTNDGDESYVLDLVRKSNTYEAVKTSHSPINGFKISRQLSSSTVDADTKVCDWMARENNTKGSQKGSRKGSSPTFSIRSKQFLRRGRKVSVAIDATPQARSNSVLRQEPIEVTKQRTDHSRNLIICQEVDIDTDLITDDSIDSSCFNTSLSSASQHQQTSSDCISHAEQQGLRIDHKHSRSDPVEMYYTLHSNDEKITSFINEDINVTCREPSTEKYPLTPEQQIYAIKRRNFPKVLPNYPCDSFGNKIGVSTASNSAAESIDRTSSSFKRNSLPPNSFMPNQLGKLPPMPPPRTISTLGRRPPSLRRQSNSITTSPVMLAQDCTEEDEPEITQNTLIVGPIVPKNLESNYSTIGRKRKPCDMGIDLNKAESHISSSAPVSPSSFEPPDPFVLHRQKGAQASIAREQCEQSASSTSMYSTFQPTPPAHHTEATYRIQPHVTDLTPLIIERSMQMKSATGKSNIPRMQNPASAVPPPSIPTTCGGALSGSIGASTSRIPTLRTALGSTSSVDQTQSQAKGRQHAFDPSAGNDRCKMSKNKSSSASTSSVTSSTSMSNSSDDTTSSSTGTVRTELKQH